MENKNIIGHALALITIFIWGTTFISTKILLIDFNPVEILFTRFILGFCALWIICPKPLFNTTKKQEFYFMMAGLCGVTLYFLFENIALTYSLASNIGIIMSAAPFFTAVLTSVVFGERLKKRFIIGFIIAMSGVMLINFNEISVLKLNPLGDILALSASVIWAVYSVLIRKMSDFNMNMVQVTRKTFFYGLIFMLPVVFFWFRVDNVLHFLKPLNILNILYLGFGASAICFTSWNVALEIIGTLKINSYIYAVPVITLIFSALILHEHITYLAIAGMILALCGLFISNHKFSSDLTYVNDESTVSPIPITVDDESDKLKL